MEQNSFVCGRGRGRGKWKADEEDKDKPKSVRGRGRGEWKSNNSKCVKYPDVLSEQCNQPIQAEKGLGVCELPHPTTSSTISTREAVGGVNEAKGGTAEVEHGVVPVTKIEAAHEFRMDTKLSTLPLTRYFYCCICGEPVGSDGFSCQVKGHSTCGVCHMEFGLENCPYGLQYGEAAYICSSALQVFKSRFRDFMFDRIKVSCKNSKNGCNVEGPWEEIKKHQEICNLFM